MNKMSFRERMAMIAMLGASAIGVAGLAKYFQNTNPHDFREQGAEAKREAYREYDALRYKYALHRAVAYFKTGEYPQDPPKIAGEPLRPKLVTYYQSEYIAVDREAEKRGAIGGERSVVDMDPSKRVVVLESGTPRRGNFFASIVLPEELANYGIKPEDVPLKPGKPGALQNPEVLKLVSEGRGNRVSVFRGKNNRITTIHTKKSILKFDPQGGLTVFPKKGTSVQKPQSRGYGDEIQQSFALTRGKALA